VLYHAVAGQVPFPAKNAVQKMIAHSSEKAKPLSSFNLAVPAALQQIVDTMMAKAPAERYATPALAAKALQAFLESQAVAVRAPQLAELVPAYANMLESEAPAEAIPLGPAGSVVATPVSTMAGVDVELVPVQASPAGGGITISRTVIMLLLGAGAMTFLLCAGLAAFLVFRSH
jgi:hypothetical protein